MDSSKTNRPAPNFADLLQTVVTEPGILSRAFFAFHNYSLGNQLLAFGQCMERGIPLGPIASFNRWKDLGRHVTKGSKAIELCMPITGKRDAQPGETPDADGKVTFSRFIFKRNWFVLAQTEGKDLPPADIPGWNADRALAALDITRIPFDLMDGNTHGYAIARKVAVSPIATEPERTLIHEIAHVLLGHTTERMTDSERTPRDIREVEAESVAMLVCAAFGLPGIEYSRGYIQHWNRSGEPINEQSARKIFKTADQILKAGRTDDETAATA